MSLGIPLPGKKTGLPPGSLVYIGKQRSKLIKIKVMQYNDCIEVVVENIADLKKMLIELKIPGSI